MAVHGYVGVVAVKLVAFVTVTNSWETTAPLLPPWDIHVKLGQLLLRYLTHSEGPFMAQPGPNSTEVHDVLPYVPEPEDTDYDPAVGLRWYWERRAHDALFLYVAPCLLALGAAGNLVCLVVLRSKAFKGTTQAYLLTALSFADLGVLFTGLLRLVIKHSQGYDVRLTSVASCKIHYFLTYLCPHVSSWTIVILTLERLTSLCRPFKVKVIFTKQRVLGSWLIMFLFMIILDLHWLVFVDIRQQYYYSNKTEILSFPRCTYPSETTHFYEGIWPWIDFAFISFIPILFIMPSNIIIMVKVYESSKNRKSSLGVNGITGHAQSFSSVTGMLLLVSTVFILTTTPLVIYFVILDTLPLSTFKDIAQTSFAYSVCSILFYTNNAINFFLYCLSGTQFRIALSVTIGCRPSTSALYQARTVSVNSAVMTNLATTNTKSMPLLQRQQIVRQGQRNRTASITLLDDVTNYLSVDEPVRRAVSETCLT